MIPRALQLKTAITCPAIEDRRQLLEQYITANKVDGSVESVIAILKDACDIYTASEPALNAFCSIIQVM